MNFICLVLVSAVLALIKRFDPAFQHLRADRFFVHIAWALPKHIPYLYQRLLSNPMARIPATQASPAFGFGGAGSMETVHLN